MSGPIVHSLVFGTPNFYFCISHSNLFQDNRKQRKVFDNVGFEVTSNQPKKHQEFESSNRGNSRGETQRNRGENLSGRGRGGPMNRGNRNVVEKEHKPQADLVMDDKAFPALG